MIALRGGYSTGTCAAAAAKAATLALTGAATPSEVEVRLPDGVLVKLPVVSCSCDGGFAEAAVRKDAGDDPDVTDQARVVVSVCFAEGGEVRFAAGEGVGMVTKPGLAVPPGEPAINPVPRQMITAAVREVTARGVRVTVSIPGGRELAARTFNPRLGIEGGLSILGTTGRVRPFSAPALREALKCSLDVAAACGVQAPVLVPGNIGERAARKNYRLTADQVIHVSNQWGFMLDEIARRSFGPVLVLGHPGKLAKLIDGEWDTHSGASSSAMPIVARLLTAPAPEATTVEGLLEALPQGERRQVADCLSEKICGRVRERLGGRTELAVVLINLAGDVLGSEGDLTPWQKL